MPTNAAAHSVLGNAYFEKGLDEQAIATYREALSLDPASVTTLTSLGTALHRIGSLDAAIELNQQAVALDPKSALARYNLSCALRDRGDFDAAAENFEELLQLYAGRASQPPESVIVTEFVWLLVTNPDDHFSDAKRTLELAHKATTLDSTSAAAWRALGAAEYRSGNWLKAAMALTKAKELTEQLAKKTSANTLLFLAMALWQLDEWDLALDTYNHAISELDKQQFVSAPVQQLRSEAATLVHTGRNSSTSTND
jgi:tetratricopeptide (TPR) repeat protein